jgi:hypothetical protein
VCVFVFVFVCVCVCVCLCVCVCGLHYQDQSVYLRIAKRLTARDGRRQTGPTCSMDRLGHPEKTKDTAGCRYRSNAESQERQNGSSKSTRW